MRQILDRSWLTVAERPGRWAGSGGLVLAGIALAWIGSCSANPEARILQRAGKAYAAGNLVEARTLLEQLQSAAPGSKQADEALNLLGVIAWQMGQAEQAYEYFNRCLQRDPEHAAAAYNLGVILYRSGDLTQAGELFTRASTLMPRDPRPLEYLAAIEVRRGNYQAAQSLLEKALALDPRSPRIMTAMGSLACREQKIPLAVKYFKEVIEDHPDYAPALYNLAVLYQDHLSQPETTEQYLKKYLQIAPAGEWANRARTRLDQILATRLIPQREKETPPATASPPAAEVTTKKQTEPAPRTTGPQSSSADDIRALVQHAISIAREGDTEKAAKLLLKAAAEAERQGLTAAQEEALRAAAEHCFDQAEAHLELGRFLLHEGRLADAARELKQAVRLDPEKGEAYYLLSRAAAATEEYDTALIAARKAVRLMPTNRDALWHLAQLYDQRLGMPQAAADAYQQFLNLFPDDPRCKQARDQLKKLQPAPPAAEQPAATATPQELRRAAQIQIRRTLNLRKPRVRNRAAALQAYNRGVSHHENQDWDRAIYYYRRALENDDLFVPAYYNLGVAYQARGDIDLAMQAYEQALALKPDMLHAAYNLALLQYNAGNLAAAEKLAEDIVSRKPDYAAAHYLLGMIYAPNPSTLKQAIAHYRRFLELRPEDPAAVGVRAWLKAQGQ